MFEQFVSEYFTIVCKFHSFIKFLMIYREFKLWNLRTIVRVKGMLCVHYFLVIKSLNVSMVI